MTRADKAKQFRSLRHLPLPTNPILPRDLERRRRRQRGLLSSVHLGRARRDSCRQRESPLLAALHHDVQGN
jgi:hypothetical protein